MYFTDSETGVLCDNIRQILEERGGFDVSAGLSSGTLELKLTGRLDAISAPDLLSFYEKHRDDIRAVSVDCRKPDYISSAGLRVLLNMQKGCAGGVTLENINDVVREILEQTGFDSFLPFIPA